MDIFKAIFCDSDVEDQEEDTERNETDQNSTTERQDSISDFISQMRNSQDSIKSNKNNEKISNQNVMSVLEKQKSQDILPDKSNFNHNSKPSENIPPDIEFKPSFVKKRKETGKISRWGGNEVKNIFSGLDFNALNEYRNKPEENKKTEEIKIVDLGDSSTDSDNGYGPELPPHLANLNRLQMVRESPCVDLTGIKSKSSHDNDGWVEKKSSSSKNSKKHKHKHKEHKTKKEKKKKHKEKHKKKSKKSHKKKYSSSSESSSDSD